MPLKFTFLRKHSLVAIMVMGMLSALVFGVFSQNTNSIEAEPLSTFIEPDGPFSVGFREFLWVDESRGEFATPDNPDDIHEIHTGIWYPAQTTENTQPRPYFGKNPDTELWYDWTGSFADTFRDVVTNSTSNIPTVQNDSPFPVIVFSPGFNLSSFYYNSFFEALASHGYVVIAIDHAYLNPFIGKDGAILNPENTIWHSIGGNGPKQSEEIEARGREVFADYMYADRVFIHQRLIELNKSDPYLQGALDLSNMIAMVHSAGDMSIFKPLQSDEHPYKAFVAYDVPIDGQYIPGIPFQVGTSRPIIQFVLEYARTPTPEFSSESDRDLYIYKLSMNHSEMSDLIMLQARKVGNAEAEKEAKQNFSKLVSLTLSSLKIVLGK